ncbi:hypothetical protein ACFY5K_25645 [Streptomyces griseofuscus]|uniref:hypothetical protein n=1 Tax=Streptomyces griseofuscus TaxID=146922 RepID=UPI0036B4D443
MDVFLSFYYRHPSGTGYVELGGGRMNIRSTETGLTVELAQKAMAAFANEGIRNAWQDSEPYDPEKIVVAGTFGDLGTLYVDGNGVSKEKV